MNTTTHTSVDHAAQQPLKNQYRYARRLTIDVFGNSEEDLRASIDGAMEGILQAEALGFAFDSTGGFIFSNGPLPNDQHLESSVAPEPKCGR